MRSHLSSFLLLLSSLVTVLPGNATLVPNLDLDSLCNQADLIVVGGVVDVRRGGETTISVQGQSMEAPSMSAELTVQSVLKGKVANSKFTFKFPLPPPPAGVIMRGQFGIFFFRESKSGIEILDPYHPHVVAVPGARGTRGTCLDQVTAELAHAVASAGAPAQTRREAVEALSTVRTPAATTALTTAAHDRDAGPRVLAMAALLARGDISWLDPAADILLSREQRLDAYLVWRLTTAIEFGVKDPKAIPTLTRLLHAREVSGRRTAAACLRNTRDKAAIGPLGEALSDSDDEVVYQAVFGLAEITGNLEWGPPPFEEFKKERAKYVAYWREWAKSRK